MASERRRFPKSNRPIVNDKITDDVNSGKTCPFALSPIRRRPAIPKQMSLADEPK